MPFKSDKQRAYLFAKKPDVAKKFGADSNAPKKPLAAMFGKKGK